MARDESSLRRWGRGKRILKDQQQNFQLFCIVELRSFLKRFWFVEFSCSSLANGGSLLVGAVISETSRESSFLSNRSCFIGFIVKITLKSLNWILSWCELGDVLMSHDIKSESQSESSKLTLMHSMQPPVSQNQMLFV